jgi:hypothetical protein
LLERSDDQRKRIITIPKTNPSVNEDILSADVTRIIARQERDDACDLLRLSASLQRYALKQLTAQRRIVLQGNGVDLRSGNTRENRVSPYSVRAELQRETPRQIANQALGDVQPIVLAKLVSRRNIYNSAPIGTNHDRQDSFWHVERAIFARP